MVGDERDRSVTNHLMMKLKKTQQIRRTEIMWKAFHWVRPIPHGIMLNPTRAWTTLLSTRNKDSEPEYGWTHKILKYYIFKVMLKISSTFDTTNVKSGYSEQ